MSTIHAADLFCGAGGTSTGLLEAAASLGIDVNLLAVNHWPVAIETHSRNHQLVKHLCETLDSVDPRKVVPGGKLRLLVASPECTHHSNARGGKPMSDQSRASAWHVTRWAEALQIDDILVENVKEWRSWGPLGVNGRPLKSRRGETFQAWVNALESLNYRVEYRVFNSADLGAVTTRERLYVRARRGGRRIVWPKQTHARDPKVCEALGLQRWRAAREILDWSDPGTSIFDRKRPLSVNTIRRICAGLRKFSGLELEPFLVKLYGTSDAAPTSGPIPTVTGQGGHLALAQPFLLGQNYCEARPAQPRSVEEPTPTVLAKGAISKVEPFLVAHFGERDGQPPRTHSVDEPTPTVTQRGAGDLVQPFLTEYHGGPGGAERVKPTTEPLPTQDTANRFGLAQPFIQHVTHDGPDRTRSVDEPLPTITGAHRGEMAAIQPFMISAGGPECPPRSTEDPAHTVLTRDHIGVASPFLSAAGGPEGQGRQPRSVEEPLRTVIGENHQAVCVPALRGQYRPGRVVDAFLVQYNGTADARSVEEPIGTLTSKPRYALLIVNNHGDRALLDIRFRMLKKIELARAQGFDDTYQFAGTNEDVVKQIGNAVEKHTARRLIHSILSDKETP